MEIVKVYNPNSWITMNNWITITRIVGKIKKNTPRISKKQPQERGAPLWGVAEARTFDVFMLLSVFVDFANSPSHQDCNPGIEIVNLILSNDNPSQGKSLDF